MDKKDPGMALSLINRSHVSFDDPSPSLQRSGKKREYPYGVGVYHYKLCECENENRTTVLIYIL
jgi:hypothetical protein